MGKMEIEAAEEFVSVLDRLVKNSDGIAKKAVYKGAGTAADEIKKEIESLPASGIAIQGKKDKRKKIGVLPEEKDDLIKGFGISPVQKIADSIDVKIGFDGYGHKTRNYPGGVPVVLTARAIISGTSFRHKNDFVRRAVSRAKEKTVDTMNNVIEEQNKKEME